MWDTTTDHANKDITGSIERFDGGCSHGELHQPGDFADDKLHQTPVVEYVGYRTKVDDNWKHLWRQNIVVVGHNSFRQRAVVY